MPKFTQPPKQSRVLKKNTPASSIKKEPRKGPAPGPGLYLRGLNLKQRFGCGHRFCEHKGATEDYMVRHMRVCPKRPPDSEKES